MKSLSHMTFLLSTQSPNFNLQHHQWKVVWARNAILKVTGLGQEGLEDRASSLECANTPYNDFLFHYSVFLPWVGTLLYILFCISKRMIKRTWTVEQTAQRLHNQRQNSDHETSFYNKPPNPNGLQTPPSKAKSSVKIRFVERKQFWNQD